jgi:hypothetical protein
MSHHAIVLAGGLLAAEDPLFEHAPGGHRSLIPIDGRPMAQWVIDALTPSSAVQSITVMGLGPDSGGMFENIKNGILHAAEICPEQNKVIVASADVPAVRPEMIDWLVSQIETAPDSFVYYNVIQKETMEARFPGANRSYVRFKDVSVCGGDLNLIDQRFFTAEKPIWKELTQNRKHPLRQAALLGLDNLLLVALHLVTLDIAVKRVCKRLDISASALRCPYAEMAMDADKPHQLTILEQDLEGQR